MPKNIIIFSDGTGQAGGINFDEARTNIYKLFRACRVGPDASIDPHEQVCFYDAGLGSAADGHQFKIGWMRWLYNAASQITGLGISANIIDCYAAIIRLYEDDDRIFLIGFSRGAYTVRSLAGVISFCGVPRQLPNNGDLPRDLKGSRALAERAVKDVYQFCSSYKKNEVWRYRRFILQTRDAISLKFRDEHGSAGKDDQTANVYPHFIGVFDTVAALGNKWLAPICLSILIMIPVGLFHLSSVLAGHDAFWADFINDINSLLIIAAVFVCLKNYIKIAPPLPNYGVGKRLVTLHFTQFKHRFYDTTLSVNVGYAKHAVSIDENRADFARVPWSPTTEKAGKRDSDGNLYFEQVWFPGVHADVGGGYEENGSRLSDTSLNWMLAAASIIPDGIKHDKSVLNLWPDATGPQHDEQKGGFLKKRLRPIPESQSTHVSEAILHKSVYRRYAGGKVVLLDHKGEYRPRNMSNHVDLTQYYDPSNSNPQAPKDPACIADNIEAKWEKQLNKPGKTGLKF
jgi:hypothetical protein